MIRQRDGEQVVDETRIDMQLVPVEGEAIPAQWRLRRDTVEVWVGSRLAAVLDRDVLAAWLLSPSAEMIVDDIILSTDVYRRLTLTVPGTSWLLPPAVEQWLRDKV
jgi:hypothetical protein